MNSIYKKPLLLFIFLSCFGIQAYSQRIYSVIFNQLPKDMQLYARDNNNMAEVPISGYIEIPGWNYFSVITYRNGVRIGYTKSVLNYSGKSSATFDLRPKIKAEMADYSFEVFACRQADSLSMVTRTDIVAGDFYVISGQSNGAATIFGGWSSKYCRTIGRTPDASAAIGAGDTLWIPAAWSWTYVGAWGMQLQRSILEKYGIPTCVINGSLPGAKISQFLDRDAVTPSAPTSLYGLLLNRVSKAKPTRIRGFFWYQGEQEAIEGITTYEQQFRQLYSYWEKDYTMVDEFIVMQINVFWSPVAGQIRDFQRRSKYLFAKTEHYSTLGLPVSDDGIHYLIDGYQILGQRLFEFLGPKHYGSTDAEVSCADVKKIFYSSADKTKITMVFDEGQKLKWPADTSIKGTNGSPVTMSSRNFFYLDGDNSKPASVKSGEAAGNRVTLTMNEAVKAKTINYLPIVKPENVSVFRGPYITNSRGLWIFSFENVAIYDALIIPSLTANESTAGISVDVKWQAATGATTYILEKKTTDAAGFVKVKEFDDKTLIYNDKDVTANVKYTYRIQAISATSESPLVETSVSFSPILAVEPRESNLLWKIYPNPVNDYLDIEFKNSTTGILKIFNLKGQSVHTAELKANKTYSVGSSIWPSGSYIISIKNVNGSTMSQKVIKQ